MSNSEAITKQMVGAQVVTGTLEAMKANKPGSRNLSTAMQQTAKLTEDVVGGALLGPFAKTSDSSAGFDVESKLINTKG